MAKMLLDQSVLSELAGDRKFFWLFNRAYESDNIEPLFTHIHLDQSNKIPDTAVRDKALFIIGNFGNTTETWGHYDDISRPGWSEPSSENLEKVLGNQAPSRGNRYDALLASTAFHKADFFVTDDKRLRNKCQALGKPVKTSREFKEFLKYTAYDKQGENG